MKDIEKLVPVMIAAGVFGSLGTIDTSPRPDKVMADYAKTTKEYPAIKEAIEADITKKRQTYIDAAVQQLQKDHTACEQMEKDLNASFNNGLSSADAAGFKLFQTILCKPWAIQKAENTVYEAVSEENPERVMPNNGESMRQLAENTARQEIVSALHKDGYRNAIERQAAQTGPSIG